ncbi:MAG: GntR family transcriptional regulator [Reyranella sp.]|nr:GntR family transcriptional regulator [Reyranella sp.]MDP3160259.1 GntR family transcriptional regulator [Reyranella sp.]
MDANPSAETPAETPLGKLVKSLPERLADRVLEDVMTGRLRPGDRLKEEELAQTHAVSRATVREALIALTRQGYVVRIPRSGARIAEFSRSDLDDLFELRAALLAIAAGRYAGRHGRRADKQQLAELETMVTELEGMAAIAATSPQAFATQSVRIQTVLTDRCGNNHLPDIYKRLAGMGTWQLIRGQASSFLTLAARQESAADWRRLARHVAAGDADAAERAARLLLEHSAVRVRQHFDEVMRLPPA